MIQEDYADRGSTLRREGSEFTSEQCIYRTTSAFGDGQAEVDHRSRYEVLFRISPTYEWLYIFLEYVQLVSLINVIWCNIDQEVSLSRIFE